MTNHAWPNGWARDPGYQDLFHRLAFHYGVDRARRIADGQDEATNWDQEAWSNLAWRPANAVS